MARVQSDDGVRFEWGPTGAARVDPGSGTSVIVDVLSFTTAVSVAVDMDGSRVVPVLRDGAFRADASSART